MGPANVTPAIFNVADRANVFHPASVPAPYQTTVAKPITTPLLNLVMNESRIQGSLCYTAADFEAFMFTNPVRFVTEQNPDFFAGTVVEDAARTVAQGAEVSA